MGKNMNRKLKKKEIQIPLKHLKGCPISIIIRVIQIKISQRQHFSFYQAVKTPKV